MTNLQHRLDLMAKYGLLLEQHQLFGAEDGHHDGNFKKSGKVAAYRGGKYADQAMADLCDRRKKTTAERINMEMITHKGGRSWRYTAKFKAVVLKVARKAVKGLDRTVLFPGVDKVLRPVCQQYGVSLTVVKTWLKVAKR